MWQKLCKKRKHVLPDQMNDTLCSNSQKLDTECHDDLQVNFQHVWVTFGSILLSFTFVFGNSIKTLFESVIFLFVVHPFDVGDMISIGTTPGDPCTVSSAIGPLSQIADFSLFNLPSCLHACYVKYYFRT